MRRLIADSDVLLFGFGGPHPWRDASQRLVAAAARGDLELHLSIEALQEFLFHRMRRGTRTVALDDMLEIERSAHVHPFDSVIWERAVGLVGSTTIRGRDAIHAATALEHGFAEIVTGDSAFADVPGLTPISPGTALARLA